MGQISSFSGSAWGIPIGGRLIQVSTAEAAATVSAMAGLATRLTLLSGGIAIAGLAVACFANLTPGGPRYRINKFAKVSNMQKEFGGVCIDETVKFKCEGEILDVPVEYIEGIETPFLASRPRLRLFDGSVYKGEISKPIRFMTTIGIQSTKDSNIVGGSIDDAKNLKSNVVQFLEMKNKDISDIIGIENFRSYFSKI